MADYTLNLAAGIQVEIAAVGNYFRVIDAISDVWVGVDGGPLAKRSQGIGEEVYGGFEKISVLSDTDQSVVIAVTNGRIDDGRLSITAPVKQDVGDTLTTFADVALAAGATTQIVAANPARREVMISNLASNSQTIRVGNASTSASQGLELAPGAAIILSTTAAVYGYNPGSSAQSVAVMEVAD